MNEFRMGLLKDRAAAIRPDLDRAREITQKAENERRDLNPGAGDRRAHVTWCPSSRILPPTVRCRGL
jgi:hypothetical protein